MTSIDRHEPPARARVWPRHMMALAIGSLGAAIVMGVGVVLLARGYLNDESVPRALPRDRLPAPLAQAVAHDREYDTVTYEQVR